MTDIRAVLEERGYRYGLFSLHADTTQAIKQALHAAPAWAALSPSQKEALEMVAHKMGRIVCGDPNYLDSWVDIVGYTQLVVDQLEEKS